MTTVTRVRSFEELRRVIKDDMRKKELAVAAAARAAARQGVAIMRSNVPVAFSELRDSIRARGNDIVADAPHAMAVNNGSRPHMPPIAPLIKWVKLRGMQGLAREKSRRRLPGPSTFESATTIAGMIASMGKNGATPIDAAERIAWAIAINISKHGTKPHHFIEKTGPKIVEIFDIELKKAFKGLGV